MQSFLVILPHETPNENIWFLFCHSEPLFMDFEKSLISGLKLDPDLTFPHICKRDHFRMNLARFSNSHLKSTDHQYQLIIEFNGPLLLILVVHWRLLGCLLSPIHRLSFLSFCSFRGSVGVEGIGVGRMVIGQRFSKSTSVLIMKSVKMKFRLYFKA